MWLALTTTSGHRQRQRQPRQVSSCGGTSISGEAFVSRHGRLHQ